MAMLLQAWRSERVRLYHVRTTLRRSNAAKGRFDIAGIVAFARVFVRYVWTLLRRRPAVVFLLLSSSRAGLMRDAWLIVTARLLGCRVVAQYRGGNFEGFLQRQAPAWRRAVGMLLRRLACVVVQGERLRAQFTGLLPAERVQVLHNGVNPEEFPPRRRPVLQAAPYRLLFVGHVAFAKGFRELARAYRWLRERYAVELWVVGTRIAQPVVASSFLPPQWYAYYWQHAAEIEAEIDAFLQQLQGDTVRFFGHVYTTVVRELMAEADVFVLPSYSEGASVAVLEAMASGLPVVTTPVGALPELVEAGQTGVLVSVGAWEELAEALAWCLQHPQWCRQAGERARQRVREHFTLEHTAAQLEQLLWGVARGND
jgi:glycosyltransferase involved in cell wall biosynthesis